MAHAHALRIRVKGKVVLLWRWGFKRWLFLLLLGTGAIQSGVWLGPPVVAQEPGEWSVVFEAHRLSLSSWWEGWNPRHNLYVATTAIPPFGERVDIQARVYEVATGNIIVSFPRSDVGWRWSPDGDHLLTWHDDFSVEIRSLAEPELSIRWLAHDAEIKQVLWSPDGQMVFSAGDDGLLKLWSQSGTLIASRNSTYDLDRAVWSPDGRYILYEDWGYEENTTYIWDVVDPNHPELVFFNTPGMSVWSPDGRLLAMPVEDTQVQVWDVASRKVITTLQAPEGPIYIVQWHPSGEYLMTFGESGLSDWHSPPAIWELATGQIVAQFRQLDHPVHYGWDETGDHFVVSDLAQFQLWDALGQTLLFEYVPTTMPPRLLSPTGDSLAVVCDSGIDICLWNTSTQTLEAELQGHQYPIRMLDWSPDGCYLVSVDENGLLRIWLRPDLPTE